MSEHDEETTRALAELEQAEQAAQSERAALEARATELGIKFRGNTSDDTLRERIAAAEAEAAVTVAHPIEPARPDHDRPVRIVLTNPTRNVRRIGTIVIAPGGKHELTARELDDERTMLKVNHMIKLGVIRRGAD
jgi:hypothetical protein